MYDWDRDANYVDFPRTDLGAAAEGEDLLQGIADSQDRVVEANEANNVAYASFRVDAVGAGTLIARGYGASPWDPLHEALDIAP